jgi:hypothetical protein
MSKSLKIVFGIIVTVAILSFAIPAIFISNGVDSYSGVERAQAQLAIDDTVQHLSSPSTYRLYTTKIAVSDLESTGDKLCPYTTTVTLYTLVGIRYSTLTVQPNCSVTPL